MTHAQVSEFLEQVYHTYVKYDRELAELNKYVSVKKLKKVNEKEAHEISHALHKAVRNKTKEIMGKHESSRN